MAKAQAATEYLIMFALVIIIALIIAGVLGGFPQIGGTVSERQSQAYWATAEVGIIKYNFHTDPAKTRVTFRNNNNYPIRIDRASFDYMSLRIGRNLAPGGSFEVNGSNTVSCWPSGGKYYYNVTVYYTDLQSGSQLTFFGDEPLVGTCQP